MKKVLVIKLVSFSGGSSSVIRTVQLLRGLLENGYQVTCLTMPCETPESHSALQHLLSRMQVVTLEHGRGYESIVKHSVSRKTGIKRFLTTLARRIYGKLFPFDHTYFSVRRLSLSGLQEQYFDVILSDSDPKTSHLAARKLIRQGLRYGSWVQYWGDPLAADVSNTCILPKVFLKHMEGSLLRGADRVVYTSPFTLEEQRAAFPDCAGKMVYSPTACQENVYGCTDNEPPLVSYIGDYLSRYRNILPLYDALCQIRGISAVIKGTGDIPLESKGHIRVEERGPAEDLTAKSDILVCVLNSRGVQLPGKIYHLAATDKKVVVVLDGDRKEAVGAFLKEMNRFYLCGNSPEEIRKILLFAMADRREWSPLPQLRPAGVARTILGTDPDGSKM